MALASSLVIPFIILIVGYVMARRPGAFDAFTRGAAVGMKTTVSLLPTMTALMVALAMFTASGAPSLIVSALSPVCQRIGIPPEILPLAVTRPISGSAATASFTELLSAYGADSFPGVVAAILMGSSDTMIYVISVYFSETRVKHAGRAFVISGASALLCLVLSSLLGRIFF